MKIILLNNLYPPHARGGAEMVTETIANGLTQLEHEVFIITTKPHFSKTTNTDNIFYLSSLYFHLGYLPKFIRLFWHWLNLRSDKAAKKLLAIYQTQGCDVLITNNLQGLGLAAGRIAREQGIKWIHIIHDVQLLHPSGLLNYGHEDILNRYASKKYQSIVKKNLGQPNLVISPSNWILTLHQQYGFFDSCLATSIPNPYPPKVWPDKKTSDSCHFVYLGQIEEHKGIILLLDSFREFCRQSKIKAQLSIAGDGQLLSLIKINYQDLPINFLGKINATQVLELLNTSSCLVVPSLCYENWPTVIIEAGLAGIPVIASNIGGNTELIHNQDYLFTPRVDILTAKLIWVATNRLTLTPPVLPELLSPSDYVSRLLSYL